MLYCEKYMTFKTEFDKIEEYWNDLSIIEKEKVLTIEDVYIINDILKITKYTYQSVYLTKIY